MGFGDKLKGLRDQAQQTVAENKDKIQGAVQSAGQVANAKTHGKYATKIAKVGERVEQSVEKFAHGDEPVDGTDASAAPVADERKDPVTPPVADERKDPVTPSAADQAASGAPPEFE